MSSCQVGHDGVHSSPMLKEPSRNNIETMLWGAACMPESRARIFEMDKRLFSSRFSARLLSLEKSLLNKKVEPEVIEYFLGNQVNIIKCSDLLDSINDTLLREHERSAMQRLAGEMSVAAKIGDRSVIVKLLRECLASLGED